MNPDVIRVTHSAIIIPNYTLGQVERVEKALSVYNAAYYRYEAVGFHYDEETKELRLPRGLDLDYIQKVFQRPLQMEREPSAHDVSSFRLKIEPRSDIQRKALSFIVGHDKYEYTKKWSQLTLDLDTGDGKTYCMIAGLSFLKMRAMIITHSDNIKLQWRDSFKRMTDLTDSHICNIDGSGAIKKLMKYPKTPPFKVYTVNHQTLQSYAKKEGYAALGLLFEKLKIGVKVFDEAHLRFANLVTVDLFTNVKKTFYLTATFERSDFKEDKVFALAMRNVPVFGRETREDKRRHIIYVPVMFNSRPNLDVRVRMKGPYGLDKNKYIDYQVKTDIFYNVLQYIIKFLDGQEGKMLMLFSKNSAIADVQTFILREFKHKTVGAYNSLVTDSVEKEDVKNRDIILSTPKSLGTGSDIPGLRFNIVTEPYSSKVSANQFTGRLREYAPDKYTFHFELIDEGFPEVVAMYKKRLPIMQKKCHQIKILNYSDNLLQTT